MDIYRELILVFAYGKWVWLSLTVKPDEYTNNCKATFTKQHAVADILTDCDERECFWL